MRQSQKTEQADRQRKIGLEDQRQAGARRMASGENTMMSGIQFQDLVLDRNNLNQAFLRVRGNKGAAGLDGMTIEDLRPYLDKHKDEIRASLADGSYKPMPVKRVEIPKPNGDRKSTRLNSSHVSVAINRCQLSG